MSWAAKRRLEIVLLIGIVVLLVLGAIFYFSLHRAPSCTDGVQNGTEQGIDCGGSCPYLCSTSEQAPVVRFTQAFVGQASTTDVLAYVDNPNQGAYARGVSYTLSLYSASSTLVAKPSGTFDLAPGATTPVFVANIPTGSAHISHAYLALNQGSIAWQAQTSPLSTPQVASPQLIGSASVPRIDAALFNPEALPIQNVVVIAALFDESGNVITASQTLLSSIPAQGSSNAVFTWNAPFARTPVRVDVLPVPQLP